MGKCGRILNRHNWYKYHVKGPPPPRYHAQNYTTYRVCRKCGTLQKQFIGYEMDSGVEWLDRGTIQDFERVIEHYESKKLKKRSEQNEIETRVHLSSEFVHELGNTEDTR